MHLIKHKRAMVEGIADSIGKDKQANIYKKVLHFSAVSKRCKILV